MGGCRYVEKRIAQIAMLLCKTFLGAISLQWELWRAKRVLQVRSVNVLNRWPLTAFSVYDISMRRCCSCPSLAIRFYLHG